MGLKVKKLKLDITIPGKTLSPVPTIIPKAKKNYLSPPVKGGGRAVKTYLKMYCLKNVLFVGRYFW